MVLAQTPLVFSLSPPVVAASSGPQRCKIVGNNFGWWVQVLLFCFSFSILIIKKQCDKQKRTWLVWLLDSSKQICGAGLLHIYNIISASLLNEKGNSLDPCEWYFATFVFDILLITLTSWLLLTALQALFNKYCKRLAFRTGDYYELQTHELLEEEDPAERGVQSAVRKVSYKKWIYQLFIWILIITTAKIMIVFLLYLLYDEVGWLLGQILSPITPYPKVELILVMLVVPALLNALQFWIIDSFIKKHKTEEEQELMEEKRGTSSEETNLIQCREE